MTDTISADRRAVLLGLGAFALAGCSDLIGPSSAPQQLYVLRPTGGVSVAGPKVDFSLAVSTSTSSQHLGSPRIALVQPNGALDVYADSAWSDRLPSLVQTTLVEAFENSGRIEAVAGDNDGFHSDYFLDAEIRDFEARYDAQDGIPTCLVRIASRLASTKGREIFANLNSVHQVAATANSVPAVVQAFDQALGQVFSEIVSWTLDAAAKRG
jgi:cholesterol transport system auxiliary component